LIQQKYLVEKLSELVLEYIMDDEDFHMPSILTSLDILCELMGENNDDIP